MRTACSKPSRPSTRRSSGRGSRVIILSSLANKLTSMLPKFGIKGWTSLHENVKKQDKGAGDAINCGWIISVSHDLGRG